MQGRHSHSRANTGKYIFEELFRRESSGGIEWLGVWNCIFSGSEFSNFGVGNLAKIALSAEFRGSSCKFRPLKNIFRTLENGHSIRHQSIPPLSAGRLFSKCFAKFLGEFIAVRIQETNPGELFMYWFRARVHWEATKEESKERGKFKKEGREEESKKEGNARKQNRERERERDRERGRHLKIWKSLFSQGKSFFFCILCGGGVERKHKYKNHSIFK